MKTPTLNIEVSAETIEKAERKNSGHCMVADSIKATGAKYVSVDIQTIRYSDPTKGLRYTYLTPRSVQRPIINFDLGQHVEPFSFRLSHGAITPMKTNKTKELKAATLDKPPRARTGGGKGVNTRKGGRTPPRASIRREFGLRAFDRVSA